MREQYLACTQAATKIYISIRDHVKILACQSWTTTLQHARHIHHAISRFTFAPRFYHISRLIALLLWYKLIKFYKTIRFINNSSSIIQQDFRFMALHTRFKEHSICTMSNTQTLGMSIIIRTITLYSNFIKHQALFHIPRFNQISH